MGDLYSVIEDLQEEEWEEIPETYLSLQENLVHTELKLPKTFRQAASGANSSKWMEAVAAEHESLKENKVYK